MSRTKRFIGGVSFGYFNQALIMVAGLWLTPFLLHRLGQQEYGLWLVGTQVLTYLALMDWGVIALLPRATAYATGRAGGVDKATDLPEIIGQTARLVLWQTPLVLLIGAALWLSTTAQWPALRLPLGVIVLAFVVFFPLRIFQAVLRGIQDQAFLGKTQLYAWVVAQALIIGLVWRGVGLEALAAGWVITQLLLVGMQWRRLRKRFPQILPARLPSLTWTKARAHLTQGGWVSLMQIAETLLNGTDLFIIGLLLGPAAVVPFVCTGKLITVLANQPQMLIQSAAPALSEMRMGEGRKRLFQVCTALCQAMLITSGAVACVVLAVNQGFVNWWVGAGQYSGLTLTLLLLLSMLLRHWNTTAVYSIFCFGYERRIALTTLADGVVTVGAAAALIWWLGPIGAPLGSIMGSCFISLPGNLSALARETEVSMPALLKPLWPWFWRFLLLMAVVGIGTHRWAPVTILAVGVTVLIVALLYAVVMLPIALRSTLGEYLRPMLAAARIRVAGLLPAV
jgi:O-antigen/teichoic acid export membrane protein